MRSLFKIELDDPKNFTNKLLYWSSAFEYASFLNSNHDQLRSVNNESSYDLILAAEAVSFFSVNDQTVFDELKRYHSQTNDWLFGHFSYDLKNQIEDLSSKNIDGIRFLEVSFFQPKYLFFLKGKMLQVGYLEKYSSESEIITLIKTISNLEPGTLNPEPRSFSIKSRISRSEYISKVSAIKQHIHRGDIYEMNFCMEFFAEQAAIDPVKTYLSLNEISQTPFSAFYKIKDRYLLSASPERFLKKSGNKLLSQPIKGTTKRGATAN